MKSLVRLFIAVTLAVTVSTGQVAERTGSPNSSAADAADARGRDTSLGKAYLRNLLEDQKGIWTSPARIRTRDLNWLVPLGALTGVLMYNDAELSLRAPGSAQTISRAKSFSDYGLVAMIGVGGAAYGFGKLTHDDHKRETGVLASEAAINSYLVTELLKTAFRRERPFEGDHDGSFGVGGSSFPSNHAFISWSIASVIAHEYPGPLTQLLAYGGAASISTARVIGRQHFPSDVLVGAAGGYLIGRYVYKAHHNPELPGAGIGSFVRGEEYSERSTSQMGSPYVPLDSWVYPALDRAAALGIVQTAFLGLRPWTRMECARLLQEAENTADSSNALSGSFKLIEELREEFAPELNYLSTGKDKSVVIDRLYTRLLGISGPPLTDGYHFHLTLVNDYGRPFNEGFNNVTGVSAHTVLGPVSLTITGEYQHAPAGQPLPPLAAAATASVDAVPFPQVPSTNAVDRFRVIEGYGTFMVRNIQFSFGKQALWWGPGESGPLLFSTNAEPIPMFRISRTSPFRLPGFLSSIFGPMRTEFFFGKLNGQGFILQRDGTSLVVPPGSSGPYIHGVKLGFKPTPNLELGFSRTAVFSGFGHPLTLHSLGTSLFNVNDSPNAAVSADPGDRRSGFDFWYRIPRLRKWLVLYSDSMSDDDPSPLANPARAAFSPGIYLPQLPHLHGLEVRIEAVNTDSPGFAFPGTNYQNVVYRSGYTNNGQLLATWMGRQGKGGMASAKYWFSPRSSLEFGYRKKKVSAKFLNGGNVDDFRAQSTLMLTRNFGLNTWVQVEGWNFPLLSATTESNTSVAVEFSYWPKWRKP